MLFRNFVEQVKDATEAEVAGMREVRDPTPMLTLDTPRGVMLVALDPRAFDSRLARVELVHGFAIPLIGEHGARQVAWSFAGWAGDGPSENPRVEVVIVTCVERERHEVWQGDLNRAHTRSMILGWHPWPPNETDGPLLVQPVQEALR